MQINFDTIQDFTFDGVEITELLVNSELIWSSSSSSLFEFTLQSDNTYSIKKRDGVAVPNRLVIPSKWNGKAVTTIGNFAFDGCDNLTSVIIGDGVTHIGNKAFRNCSSLISMVIPDSVTTIGDSAFRNCSSLTSVVIGDNVTTIGNYAFDSCSSLTNVNISNNVTYLGSSAFNNTALYNDLSNWDNSVLYIDKYLIEAKTTLSGSYIIKNGTLCIGNKAFRNCYSLTSVVIPDSVTTIGNETFYGCSKLTSVVIPDSVTTIGNSAFYGCFKLTSVIISNNVAAIDVYTFGSCSKLTSVVIPDSVTRIGRSAFDNCSSLTDVYYTGSEAQWAEISIGSSNSYLTNATIHYNYVPDEPSVPNTYNLTVAYEEGSSGNISTTTIREDEQVTIELSIEPDYTYNLSVDNAKYRTDGNAVIIYNPTGDVTVTVYTIYIRHALNVAVDGEGISVGAAPSTIREDEEVEIEILREPDYYLIVFVTNAEWRSGENNNIIIYNAIGDVSVNISSFYEPSNYNLNVAISPEGAATTDAPSSIEVDGLVTFNVFLEPGYEIVYVEVENASYERDGERITIFNPTGEVTVHIDLVERYYTLNVIVEPENTAEVFAPFSIREGEEVTVDIVPDPGYVIGNVMVLNADYTMSGNNTIILSNATDDVTLTVQLTH